MKSNYLVYCTESTLEIKPNKIILSDLISYLIFFSVGIYFSLNLISVTKKHSFEIQILISILISIPLSLFLYRLTETKVKIIKKESFLYFNDTKINIYEIEEINVEQYISSDLATGITSISLKTKNYSVIILKSIMPKDLNFFLETIKVFLNINSLKVTHTSR